MYDETILRLVLLATACALVCNSEPYQMKSMDDFWNFVQSMNKVEQVYMQDIDLQHIFSFLCLEDIFERFSAYV